MTSEDIRDYYSSESSLVWSDDGFVLSLTNLIIVMIAEQSVGQKMRG